MKKTIKINKKEQIKLIYHAIKTDMKALDADYDIIFDALLEPKPRK